MTISDIFNELDYHIYYDYNTKGDRIYCIDAAIFEAIRHKYLDKDEVEWYVNPDANKNKCYIPSLGLDIMNPENGE